EAFGWSYQANYRSWRLGRRRAGSPVRRERRHPVGFVGHGGSRRQGEFL
ncbi:MAG: hypothetical protein, partial [Olavius algarvensis Gamma 1 endosymbiont]